MKIESIKINKLKPATYNPRQISTKQYNDLKKSIERFGLVDPIIVNKDMTIIGGHQRYKICKELKHTEIDCVVLDLSKEEERELNIRLNKNTGDFDMDILANEFDIDQLVDWGFKHIDLDINIDKITEGNTEDDHIPEVKESRVKLGDVWQLGKHRLMCGDSTKESDVNKIMNGQKADMVFTDPPYGMNLETDNSKKMVVKGIKTSQNHKKVLGDNEDFTTKLITTIFENFDYCKEIFVFGIDYFAELIKEKGSWFVWDKYPTDKNNERFGSAFELIYSKQKHKRKIYRIMSLNVGHYKREKITHPTQKPSDLICEILKEYSKKDNIIIDLYLGSGSTLIACEKTNRICYGMELDTKYCDVIIERWEQFTGQKATKL
jgi:DNA modification methylase